MTIEIPPWTLFLMYLPLIYILAGILLLEFKSITIANILPPYKYILGGISIILGICTYLHGELLVIFSIYALCTYLMFRFDYRKDVK